MMIGRSYQLLSRRLYPAGPCKWPQSTYTREKLGLSLVSLLGLTAYVGCSWSRLNLDSAAQDSSSTQENIQEHQKIRTNNNVSYTRDDGFNVYVRNLHTHTQTFEQTVFPGNHTGVARYDTAKCDSPGDHATDFAAGVLPVPTGYWSIFALLSADDTNSSNPGAISWIRRNIVAAVAGALADAHSAGHPPPSTLVDDALRQALVHLDDDARTGQPWAQNAGRASALLAFFDSESRVLRVANTGAGRASATYECTELVGPGSPRYLELETTRSHRVDVEELVSDGVFPSRGPLDASSVETRSIEVRNGDFLMLGSESAWSGMEGSEAVRAVGAWIREQDGPAPEGRLWPRDPALGFDFPRKYEEDDFGLGWVGAMVPAMMRNFDTVFSPYRGNPASCVLRHTELERVAESGSAPDQDDRVTGRCARATSSSGWVICR
ncbi:hypothetical protein EDB92DRAFT_1858359 [Lactarius akahatsu]|uniref:Uncharacterized protein n=1 Tax=Lactarius akahatsu TaxID=416441 RepID=A0AAD4LHS2_9AGAM|nr:hypothetical protein EDB92DRAFT_1858359 [Lactarius akahatsu]